MFSGHGFDEKLGTPGVWPKAAGSCDRLNRWRDTGMLGVSPAKRFDTTRVDARRSIDLGLKAHVPVGARLTPGNATEWTATRMNHGATVSTPTRSATPSVAPSVISHCPSNSALTDTAVESMVETIDIQEKELRGLHKEIMGLMMEVQQATRQEEKLKDFIERCSAATELIWKKNTAMQERNAGLKRKLDLLQGS